MSNNVRCVWVLLGAPQWRSVGPTRWGIRAGGCPSRTEISIQAAVIGDVSRELRCTNSGMEDFRFDPVFDNDRQLGPCNVAYTAVCDEINSRNGYQFKRIK